VWDGDGALDGLAVIVVHAPEGELVPLARAVLLPHNRREACRMRSVSPQFCERCLLAGKACSVHMNLVRV
jgi:hypothetical protein